ncbi:MAG TPA: hypothetical protein VIK24_04240, partial [Pyrinomonadaceae bacterium]
NPRSHTNKHERNLYLIRASFSLLWLSLRVVKAKHNDKLKHIGHQTSKNLEARITYPALISYPCDMKKFQSLII